MPRALKGRDSAPSNEDDLAIPIGELRSQAFELGLLNQNATRGRGRRFVKAHARQLAQSIERSRDELTLAAAEPQHASTRPAALQRSIEDRVIVVDDDAPRPGGRRR